jgi:hypothetical protein
MTLSLLCEFLRNLTFLLNELLNFKNEVDIFFLFIVISEFQIAFAFLTVMVFSTVLVVIGNGGPKTVFLWVILLSPNRNFCELLDDRNEKNLKMSNKYFQHL